MDFLEKLHGIDIMDHAFDALITIQSNSRRNSRITFGFTRNFYMENFLYHDHDDNDQYMSREMIKQQGQNLVKAKAVTSKRKKKQKASS